LEALTYISFHQNWFITYKKLQKPQYIWLEDEHFILAVETSWVHFIVTINNHSFEYRLEFTNLGCQLIKLGQVITIAHEENNLYILDVLLFIPEHVYVITTDNTDALINFIDVSNKALITDLVPLHYDFTVSTNISTSLVTIWHCYIMLWSVKKLFQQNMVKNMHVTDNDSHNLNVYKSYLEDK